MNKPLSLGVAAIAAAPLVIAGYQFASAGVSDLVAAARKGKAADRRLGAPDWKTQSEALATQNAAAGDMAVSAGTIIGGAAVIGIGLVIGSIVYGKLT